MTRFKIGPRLALWAGVAMATQMAASQAIAGSLEGQWGGDQLQLVIDASGGRVDMSCASGTLKGPLKLASNGAFLASGTFQQHQAGPQRADGDAAPANARYSGDVKGDVMMLTILATGSDTPQEFTLRKGVRVKLIRCF